MQVRPATPRRILILGGTYEARGIAKLLMGDGHDVTTSLAGVTKSPALPEGKLRIGGFGGVAGLVDYLIREHFDVLVDATHPFAAIMSAHVHEAAHITSSSLLRFQRTAWRQQQGDCWLDVASLDKAASVLPLNAVALVTTGRKHLSAFFARKDVSGLIRTVEPIADALPLHWRVIIGRPPQSLESEIWLMREHNITHLITKNAGGDQTRSKLDAARLLGLPVVMVARPYKPDCETFSDMQQFAERLCA